ECFYDLVIEVAIVRPGPIQGDMVHPYLRRRQGLEPVTYPSEEVQAVLGRTLGVPIFQEQVIKVAQVAAGFTPGEADQLRRSIGAWRRRGALEQFEQRLVEGMVARGYRQEFAEQIYRQILGFGEYGFPESHAASFALLVYVSAWLKHYQPAAFFAALINSQPMGFYAPAQLIREARRQGVVVRPVDVGHSDWDCTLEAPFNLVGGDARGAPVLRLGLCLVKGLSRAGADRLVTARARDAFRSTADLAGRADLDRGDLQALAAGGALRGIAGDRHRAAWQVMAYQPELPLFGSDEFRGGEEVAVLPVPTAGHDILADYASLGLSLAPHPLALLRGHLDRRGLVTAAQANALENGMTVRTGGLVINRQHPSSAKNVTFITLEDETGQVNLVVWQQVAVRQRPIMLGARLMGVFGQIQREGRVIHLVARRLYDYSSLLGGLEVQSRDFR
ncbi:MAG: OB-fold nucleic acid binding domain-containing protein, partial [Pseudomonadota bacterium]